MADSKEALHGIMVAAMAWRVKYRKVNSKGETLMLQIPITALGVHKKNRGGVYPAGVRCKSLNEEILLVGFAKEEVNHG